MKEKIKIFYQLKLNSLFTVGNYPKAKKGKKLFKEAYQVKPHSNINHN